MWSGDTRLLSLALGYSWDMGHVPNILVPYIVAAYRLPMHVVFQYS